MIALVRQRLEDGIPLRMIIASLNSRKRHPRCRARVLDGQLEIVFPDRRTRNEATRKAKISTARRRAVAVAARKPRQCEACGAETRRSEIMRWRGKWCCGNCVNAGVEPLKLEDFTTGASSALSWAGEEVG